MLSMNFVDKDSEHLYNNTSENEGKGVHFYEESKLGFIHSVGFLLVCVYAEWSQHNHLCCCQMD